MEIAAEAEQARTADKNAADLKRCGWRCWWCLAYDPDHSPDKCTAREMPDMSDFSQRKPRTRQGSSRRSSSARPQTTRTAQEQRQHSAQRKSAWQERSRDLRAAAIERTTEFVNDLTAPIVGSGPLGQYTRAQMLGLEFALTLPSHFQDMPGFLDQVRRAHTRPTQRPTDTRRLPRAQAPHSKINASALQRFARQVKADGAFDSVASLRGPGEQPITDFVLLHLRARYQNGRSDDLLNLMQWFTAQQRAGHPLAPSVKALPDDAALMTVVRTGALASKPRRGRPPNADGSGDGDFSMRRNWELGGYTIDSMQHRAMFDSRRINVSQKQTQADVLPGAGLIIKGAPTSVEELRRFKPSKRRVQISHATTASKHSEQLHEYHVEMAASKGDRKLMCACLQPQGDGIYTIDPRWKGDSTKSKDKATIALIFEVEGEGLRAMPDGYKGEKAWKLTRVTRQ